LPFDFNEKLKKTTKDGFRVLACATKPLTENFILETLKDKEKKIDVDNQAKRNKFEKDLIFLGFIRVSNKLKKDTTTVIQSLKEGGLKLVISTGDSNFTTISIAKECKLIESNKIIILLDVINEKIKYININLYM
jgi:cation-transporting ATPase 13A2